MNDPGPGALRQRFSRLSTAVKMLVILGLALFPLGLVAILASVDAVRDGRAGRQTMAQVEATRSAHALDELVARNSLALGIAAATGSRSGGCDLMKRAQRTRPDLALGRYALFDEAGRLSCSSEGFAPTAPPRGLTSEQTSVWLDPAGPMLRYAVRAKGAYATAGLDIATLRGLGGMMPGERIDFYLQENGARLQVLDRDRDTGFRKSVASRARLSHSNVFAVVSVGALPISASEIVAIVLPLVMWLAAALLGWLIVDRLLLRPIKAMQEAVLAYQPGGPSISVPSLNTPATEIRDLGHAFVRVTDTIAAHEAELEAAIARQARLVREVHHRVKNNLQVVASLLNLHARGARSADAADAYASIQRRVDALAVVHRSHFAELEDNRGVALRPLLSELTSNLRGTAPEGAASMAITLDLDPVYANQDVAVSVAFFVTEIVEHAMLCTPDKPVGVSLTTSPSPTVARLKLTSASLREGTNCDAVDVRQFERITTGLSRQLRAVLDRNGVEGSYGIDISIQQTTSI